MPRPVLSSEDVESFREELSAAATRRFAESGYAGVTLRALADELGVSPMTPYRYFRDKDEILAAVRAAGFRRFAGAQEQAYSAADEPRARLHGLAVAYAEFARREPASYRIMFEMNRPGDTGNPELARERARAWAPLHRAVAAATEAGLLRGDAATVAHLFWAALHGLVSLELAGSLRIGHSLSTLFEPMLDTLFRGRASQEETP
jgi:AcrR family transcriptional regulator